MIHNFFSSRLIISLNPVFRTFIKGFYMNFSRFGTHLLTGGRGLTGHCYLQSTIRVSFKYKFKEVTLYSKLTIYKRIELEQTEWNHYKSRIYTKRIQYKIKRSKNEKWVYIIFNIVDEIVIESRTRRPRVWGDRKTTESTRPEEKVRFQGCLRRKMVFTRGGNKGGDEGWGVCTLNEER